VEWPLLSADDGGFRTVLEELSAVPLQPYYVIGQWRLPTRRRIRAFVCSAQGTVHLARVDNDRSDLSPEELSDCYNRIFPDVLRTLRRFTLEVPGLLKDQSSPPTSGTADSSHSRRFGEVLVEEQVITTAQLEMALHLQRTAQTYAPIGQILLEHRFTSRKTITTMLQRYGKRARLGELLLKAGRITAAQLDEGLKYHRRHSVPIGEAFIRLGWLTELTMRDALCTQLHVNFLDIDPIVIDQGLARLVSERYARRLALVPLLRVNDVLVVAMDDPSRADLIAIVERALGLQVETVTTVTAKLQAAIHRLYRSSKSLDVRPLNGRDLIIGPIRDHAVAELIIQALEA
jgi:hypothetical protein